MFVIDSADETKIEECKEELEDLLSQPKLDKVPMLIFANKQDLSFAASSETVKKRGSFLARDDAFSGVD